MPPLSAAQPSVVSNPSRRESGLAGAVSWSRTPATRGAGAPMTVSRSSVDCSPIRNRGSTSTSENVVCAGFCRSMARLISASSAAWSDPRRRHEDAERVGVVPEQVRLRVAVRHELHLSLAIEHAELESPLDRRAPQSFAAPRPARGVGLQQHMPPLDEALDDAGDAGTLEILEVTCPGWRGRRAATRPHPPSCPTCRAAPAGLEELPVLLRVPRAFEPDVEPSGEVGHGVGRDRVGIQVTLEGSTSRSMDDHVAWAIDRKRSRNSRWSSGCE